MNNIKSVNEEIDNIIGKKWFNYSLGRENHTQNGRSQKGVNTKTV